MFHGSIVVSREALLAIGGYDEHYRYASDRDLFFRFLRRFKAANLGEPLVGIRRHPGQDSFSLAAANEYIEVFLSQLSDRGYLPEEVRILRRSLAYSHLFRARCLSKARSFLPWGRDQLKALRYSPVTWGRHWVGQAVGDLLPPGACEALRGEFWRSS
jgi:hypothetical protein